MPLYFGCSHKNLWFWEYLGNTMSEIIINSITKPWMIYEKVGLYIPINFLIKLIAPYILLIKPQNYFYLIGTLPYLPLFLISGASTMTSLMHYY